MQYWISAAILTILNAVCVCSNLFMLPGNWLMVGTLCLFLLAAGQPDAGPDWTTLLIVAGLAALGEFLEVFTGSAKAARLGASRRALVLSLILSMVFSVLGTFVVPIPVVGTLIGAVLGAASGAFGGAWLGEAWKGSDPTRRTQVGTAAMTGRLLGMLAKLTIGVAIFIFQLVSLWL
jgi:uncharacterized protein YqgC (DUF456 family)